MNDFGINEMLEMQAALQEKYKDLWKPIGPERGQDQLLWMIGEIGEVIDIVKKHGGQRLARIRNCEPGSLKRWRMFSCITTTSCYATEYRQRN